MSKKAMISQPMNGLSDDEIKMTRDVAKRIMETHGFEVINTFFYFDDDDLLSNGTKSLPLYYLAQSLVCMSGCDAVVFCGDWEKARGCQIEHAAAEKYGLECFYLSKEAIANA